MRILLGNYTLATLAGSETWTYALALELKRQGHEVFCYSPTLGIWSNLLRKEGISSYSRIYVEGAKPFSILLEEKINHEYDVIIASHYEITRHLRREFPKTPIIANIHGILHFVTLENGDRVPAPEHPALDSGINQFTTVSEEAQKKLKNDYNIDAVLVRNFLDISFFKKIKKPRPQPKQILLNTNYAGKDDPEVVPLREAAKELGLKLAAIGINFASTPDIKKALEDSDIVVGMGRSVLEGVAAGRLGIVHGRWGTGGVITENTVEALRKVNFSGRNPESSEKLPFWTKEQFIEAIKEFYQPSFLNWGGEYMAREHNVAKAAQIFVQTARELKGEFNVKAESSGLRPYRRAKDVGAS